jgi:phospholipid transport system transporter-binding protein
VSEGFAIGVTLTHESANVALSAGLAQIKAGATAVDCAPLKQFDSSALAVLIAWQRAARERGATLSVLNLPTALAALARAYGVDTLLHERH